MHTATVIRFPAVEHFYMLLFLLTLSAFSRLLLVWLGFEWRRRQG